MIFALIFQLNSSILSINVRKTVTHRIAGFFLKLCKTDSNQNLFRKILSTKNY